jgi:hexosaminidase
MKKRLFLHTVSFLILFSCLICSLYAAEKTDDSISVKCGDIDFYYTPQKGVDLSIFGISFSGSSTLWVISPDWTHRFYGAIDQPDLIKEATVEDFQGGKKITLHHYLKDEKKCPFKGTETFYLFPDNTYRVELDFSFTKDVPAIFEWKIAEINPTIIVGTPYLAINDTKTTKGIVPLDTLFSGVNESMLCRNFRTLDMMPRFGRMRISTGKNSGLVFFDYRKNIWAENGNPYFWMGILSRKITEGKNYKYSVSFKFSKKPDENSAEDRTMNVAPFMKHVENALCPNRDPEYIIPAPKQLKFFKDELKISNGITIFTGKNPGTDLKKSLRFFIDEMKNLYKIDVKVVKDIPSDNPGCHIILGEKSRFSLPSKMCEKRNLILPDHPEAYTMFVDKKNVCISANNEKGIFYSLSSLLQLVKVDENGISFKSSEIIDYPALDFRGIHCLSGKNAGKNIAKALRTLMARFKINSLIWECQYIIWDSCPDLEHPEYAMEKKDAKKVVDAAEKHFINLIPLVQSLGHSEWIFTNEKNLDIAEDPETPYAYCPENPDTYKFIFKVYQEALDFFKPETFHIGHDEVTMRGRFPWKSKKSGKSATDLIMEDTLKLHKWFAEKGHDIMLWGDMFLWKTEGSCACLAPSLEDAKKRRSLLPKDVTVCDWHYTSQKPEDYKSLKFLKEKGFKTIGAGWYRPENIRNLARACVLYGAEGYLQTTWAGFNFKIDGNEEAWFQYWAYIWAANYAWTGENTEIDELPFSAPQVFMDLWFEKKPLLEKKKGFMFDLRPYYNRRLSDNDKKSGWANYGPGLDLSSFPYEKENFGETRFLTGKNASTNGAIILSGIMNPPGNFPASINLKMEASTLKEMHFLLCTIFRTNDYKEVGEIIFLYSDGEKESMKLIYGRNIFAFNDVRSSRDAGIAWEGLSKNKTKVALWDLCWKNPHPEKKITSVTIISNNTEVSPVLFSVTGVEK